MTAAERLAETLKRCLLDDGTATAVYEEIEQIGSYHDDGSFVICGDDDSQCVASATVQHAGAARVMSGSLLTAAELAKR